MIKKKSVKESFPYIVIVSIVAVVAIVILVLNATKDTETSSVDEKGNIVGEASRFKFLRNTLSTPKGFPALRRTIRLPDLDVFSLKVIPYWHLYNINGVNRYMFKLEPDYVVKNIGKAEAVPSGGSNGHLAAFALTVTDSEGNYLNEATFLWNKYFFISDGIFGTFGVGATLRTGTPNRGNTWIDPNLVKVGDVVNYCFHIITDPPSPGLNSFVTQPLIEESKANNIECVKLKIDLPLNPPLADLVFRDVNVFNRLGNIQYDFIVKNIGQYQSLGYQIHADLYDPVSKVTNPILVNTVPRGLRVGESFTNQFNYQTSNLVSGRQYELRLLVDTQFDDDTTNNEKTVTFIANWFTLFFRGKPCKRFSF